MVERNSKMVKKKQKLKKTYFTHAWHVFLFYIESFSSTPEKNDKNSQQRGKAWLVCRLNWWIDGE